MKQLIVFALSIFILSSSCRKNKDTEPQLPPETTTGAMTFGCKVNGKVFIPRDGNGDPGLFAQYVYLGSGPGGGWFLSINITDNKSQGSQNLTINTDSLLLESNITYNLKKAKAGVFGKYFDFPEGSLNVYEMASTDTGQLTITKHDQAQGILSGRFWFDATNASGQKVEIREGRFDIVY